MIHSTQSKSLLLISSSNLKTVTKKTLKTEASRNQIKWDIQINLVTTSTTWEEILLSKALEEEEDTNSKMDLEVVVKDKSITNVEEVVVEEVAEEDMLTSNKTLMEVETKILRQSNASSLNNVSKIIFLVFINFRVLDGSCKFGDKCSFAHGDEDLRKGMPQQNFPPAPNNMLSEEM
jgi:hypothetical protein